MDKNKVRVDLLREWRQERLEDGIRFSYPVPERARGFCPRGFVRESDSGRRRNRKPVDMGRH